MRKRLTALRWALVAAWNSFWSVYVGINSLTEQSFDAMKDFEITTKVQM